MGSHSFLNVFPGPASPWLAAVPCSPQPEARGGESSVGGARREERKKKGARSGGAGEARR